MHRMSKALVPVFMAGLLAPGVIFAADSQTTPTLTTLHTFLNSPTDGNADSARVVVEPSGIIYGTTTAGGPGSCQTPGLLPGCGIVFQLTPPAYGSGAYTETILHAFQGGADSSNPLSTIIKGPSGSWWGTTLTGGSGAGQVGDGTVYELDPVGDKWLYKTVFSFSASNGGAYFPEANMTYWNGNLYTTTQNGGQFGDYGTVIELVRKGSGWSYNILHAFDGADGNQIQAALAVDTSSGVFYGAAQNGGPSNWGTIWQMIPPAAGSTAWTFNKLYDFTGGDDGGYIFGSPVIGPDGVIYGVAQMFGEYGQGTLWTLTPRAGGAWAFQVIHQFGAIPADGSMPASNVVVTSKGVIYGTTLIGGANNKGALFAFTPVSGGGYQETILWNFTGGADGEWPYAAPTLAGTNALIGSCLQGGSAGAGTIWKVSF
jgi:hypothetical protein